MITPKGPNYINLGDADGRALARKSLVYTFILTDSFFLLISHP